MAMDIGENEGFDESSALSILQRMIELLTDTELNPMNRADDADGSENEAEARLKGATWLIRRGRTDSSRR